MWNKVLMSALVGAMVLAGCQGIIKEIPEESTEVSRYEGPYTFMVQASKGVDTKALSLDESTLNAYWKSGEKAYVFKGGSYVDYLDVTPGSGDKPTSATLSRDVTISVTQGDGLTLLFPRQTLDYTGQDGTLATIESSYDYATASVTVNDVDDVNHTISASDADFQNQQSIYRFAFKVGGTGDAIPVKGIKVSSANDALVRSCGIDGTAAAYGSISVDITGNALSEVYASLRNIRAGSSQADVYSFDVIGNDQVLYLGEKEIPSSVMDKQGRFISAKSISVTKSNLARSGIATEVW